MALAEDAENHTIRLLQEIRAEVREMREHLTKQIDHLTTRVDGNTIILNMLAGLLHNHEERMWDPLESTCRHASLSIL